MKVCEVVSGIIIAICFFYALMSTASAIVEYQEQGTETARTFFQ